MSCAQCAPQSLLSSLLSPSGAASSPAREKHEPTGLTTYDQKQSGKYNIHLNIKDVAIIALDSDHLDSDVGDFGEDYYEDYDLADFTVKPIFGIIGDIPSDKPSSTTVAPALIHSESDGMSASNETQTAAISTIEEPIIKDPVNKTQSVVILNGPSLTPKPSSASAATLNSNASNGIVITTSTPAPEDLPPKPSLADLANVQNALKPSIFPSLFPTKPNEIPVQIILEPATHKQSSRQRPNGNWHLRNRIRATPSHNRRITPPHDIDDSPSHIASHGNSVYHKSSLNRQNQHNCALGRNGQCQNSNRRFGSPTL